jgi:hypothetical protein
MGRASEGGILLCCFRRELPPLPEQHKIYAWVGATASRFDALLSKTREQIAKFQEYLTALISAAVTGKIDVRGPGGESAGVDKD